MQAGKLDNTNVLWSHLVGPINGPGLYTAPGIGLVKVTSDDIGAVKTVGGNAMLELADRGVGGDKVRVWEIVQITPHAPSVKLMSW